MPNELAKYFPADYLDAQHRFRAAAQARDAVLHHLPIDARGPGGTALCIDIACLGAGLNQNILVHTSGLHGVEAFAGSAIQLALLERLHRLPDSLAVVLVHVLNPYGMAWLRRANENNVDLNRNFLLSHEPRPPTHTQLTKLRRILHPNSPPAADLFYLSAALQVIRHGFEPVRQAIAQGQYEYPQGLFYGGQDLQQGPRMYWDWVRTHLLGARRGVVIDVHTGLGKHGYETLFCGSGTNSASPRSPGRRLRYSTRPDSIQCDSAMGDSAMGDSAMGDSAMGDSAMGDSAMADSAMGDSAMACTPRTNRSRQRHGYSYTGGHAGVYAGNDDIDFITQEFGTCNAMRVLHALREENRWHHFGDGGTHHRSKRRLLAAFCPENLAWRSRVVEQGLARARCMMDMLRAGIDKAT